jgi:hypothetical protein
VYSLDMDATATMTKDEALAELRNVGADARVWAPAHGGRETIYVSNPTRTEQRFYQGQPRTVPAKIAEVWCSASGNVNVDSLWAAVAAVVRS